MTAEKLLSVKLDGSIFVTDRAVYRCEAVETLSQCVNCGMGTDHGPHCRHCLENGLIVVIPITATPL